MIVKAIVDKIEGVKDYQLWEADCADVIVIINGKRFIAENRTGFKLWQRYHVHVDLSTDTPFIVEVIRMPKPSMLFRGIVGCVGVVNTLSVLCSATESLSNVLWKSVPVIASFVAIDYFLLKPDYEQKLAIYEKHFRCLRR